MIFAVATVAGIVLLVGLFDVLGRGVEARGRPRAEGSGGDGGVYHADDSGTFGSTDCGAGDGGGGCD